MTRSGVCGDVKKAVTQGKDLLLRDRKTEFSLPYQPVADIAVVSAMAYIIGKLKDEISVPFGVNVVSFLTRLQISIDLGYFDQQEEQNTERSCFQEHIAENKDVILLEEQRTKRSVTSKDIAKMLEEIDSPANFF